MNGPKTPPGSHLVEVAAATRMTSVELLATSGSRPSALNSTSIPNAEIEMAMTMRRMTIQTPRRAAILVCR
jgi:hypothetical protein